jgi:hypothetical protein
MCEGYTTEAKLCRRSATPFFRRRISLILMISLQTSVEDGYKPLMRKPFIGEISFDRAWYNAYRYLRNDASFLAETET